MAAGTYLFAGTAWGLWEEQSVEMGRLAAGLTLAAASFGLSMTVWVARGMPESGDSLQRPLITDAASVYMFLALNCSQFLQQGSWPTWMGLLFPLLLGFTAAALVQRICCTMRPTSAGLAALEEVDERQHAQ